MKIRHNRLDRNLLLLEENETHINSKENSFSGFFQLIINNNIDNGLNLLRKEVKKMYRTKFLTGRAKKPRLQRAIEVIQSVREERSKSARGDFLLHQAKLSLSSYDIDSAKSYLEMFLVAAPNVSAEHHAVVNVILTRLLAHRKLKIPSTILNFLDLLVTILKLVGRNLLSCRSLGISIPVYIYVNKARRFGS